jgi:hypothetical protein
MVRGRVVRGRRRCPDRGKRTSWPFGSRGSLGGVVRRMRPGDGAAERRARLAAGHPQGPGLARREQRSRAWACAGRRLAAVCGGRPDAQGRAGAREGSQRNPRRRPRRRERAEHAGAAEEMERRARPRPEAGGTPAGVAWGERSPAGGLAGAREGSQRNPRRRPPRREGFRAVSDGAEEMERRARPRRPRRGHAQGPPRSCGSGIPATLE